MHQMYNQHRRRRSRSYSPVVRSMSASPSSSESEPESLRAWDFPGDEKMSSMGCMPCSSRTPVSGSVTPVFLRPGQPGLPGSKSQPAFLSAVDHLAYRPLSPNVYKCSFCCCCERRRPAFRGAMATVAIGGLGNRQSRLQNRCRVRREGFWDEDRGLSEHCGSECLHQNTTQVGSQGWS